MIALDFEYDNQYLSDYNFIVCKFDYSTGAVSSSAGSQITFNKVPRYRGTKHSLIGTKYNECLTATFDICKNPEIYDHEEMEITEDEIRDIMRWLNRKEFLRFQVIDNKGFADACFYNVSFNIDKITIHEVVYGMRLTMNTDRPFGYGSERVFHWEINDVTEEYDLRDISDEIGSIYPFVSVTCLDDGDISIINETEGCTMTFLNCSDGEVITVDDTQIVTTSDSAHDINNDFNYDFFRIGNTFQNNSNKIKVSSPCILEIRYFPIIKNSI